MGNSDGLEYRPHPLIGIARFGFRRVVSSLSGLWDHRHWSHLLPIRHPTSSGRWGRKSRRDGHDWTNPGDG
jgi:hypothetical protein